MKHPFRKLIAIAAIVSIAAGAALYLMGDRIALRLVSNRCNLSIKYTAMQNERYRRFDFTDLAATDNKTGIGILAKRAAIRPLWGEILAGRIGLDFSLSDVSFVKQAGEKTEDLGSFEGLAALPFSSRWTYRDMSGTLIAYDGNIRLAGFKAAGDIIKFAIDGDLRSDASVSSDITIYFSDSLFSKIPKKYIKGVLKDEGDGWQSFSMKLSGNYKEPSIQVTGRQFRLNIGYTSN